MIPARPVYTPRSGRSTRSGPVRQDMGSGSLLAGGAEVGAAPTDHNALDGCAADATGLAGARIDVVVELEKSSDAIRIHIIGDRGATKLNRFGENFNQRCSQTYKFSASKATGVAAGTEGDRSFSCGDPWPLGTMRAPT